jgi:hypothetical protein
VLQLPTCFCIVPSSALVVAHVTTSELQVAYTQAAEQSRLQLYSCFQVTLCFITYLGEFYIHFNLKYRHVYGNSA